MSKIKQRTVVSRWTPVAKRSWAERIGDRLGIPCVLTVATTDQGIIDRFVVGFTLRKYLGAVGVKASLPTLAADHTGKACVSLIIKRSQYKFAVYLARTAGYAVVITPP